MKITIYGCRTRRLANFWRAASGFLELGAGERVAIMMANRPEFHCVHFGLQLIGGVSV
jgi:acyl-CoA synthetase (AMP-forming)/AMP-acid ligase II